MKIFKKIHEDYEEGNEGYKKIQIYYLKLKIFFH